MHHNTNFSSSVPLAIVLLSCFCINLFIGMVSVTRLAPVPHFAQTVAQPSHTFHHEEFIMEREMQREMRRLGEFTTSVYGLTGKFSPQSRS